MAKNLFNITIQNGSSKKIISVPFASSGFIKFDKSLEYGYKVISDKELIKLANIPRSLTTPQDVCTIIYGDPEYGSENPEILSPSGYSLLDTRNGQKTYTLPTAVDCTIKTIGLLEDWGFPAIINVEPFGTLRINPGDKPVQLIFKDKWRIMSVDKSFSPYEESSRILSTDSGNKFGKSVALSADGSIMVIGEPGKVGGATSIYSRTGTTWNKVTERTKYPGSTSNEGWSVAISADGKRIVSGSPEYSGESDNTGAVIVYTFNNGVWDDGIVLSLGITDALEGQSVTISANGYTIIVSTDSGIIKYGYNINNVWTAFNIPQSLKARSLATSADGDVIVAGFLMEEDSGIEIYTLTNNLYNSTILSLPIFNQYEGTSVDISDDGCTIVVGVPDPNDSYNIVYEKVNEEWNDGFKLYPPEHLENIYEGSAVAICGFGNTIISSCPASPYHLLHIYTRTIGGWIFDREIQSDNINTNASMSITTSSDGSITMLGDSEKDDNAGQVIMFY